MVTPLIGVGGWPDYWKDVPDVARNPAFWKTLGLNAYRCMVGTDQLDDLKSIQSYVLPWIERGFHVRLAVNWGRNPPMPDYLACFSRDPKAIDLVAARLVQLARFMDALGAAWSLEPCQECEVWSVRYGLDPSMWDVARKDWEAFIGPVWNQLSAVTKAPIDIGSPANQSVSGWDSPYWPERFILPQGLHNVRSDAHFYVPKAVGIDGAIRYPSATVQAPAGKKLTAEQIARAKVLVDKETFGLGPNKKGVLSAWRQYEAAMRSAGLPIGVGEVSSMNRQHALDMLGACKGADVVLWWDPRMLFRNGQIDLVMIRALIGS